ncbi:MAG: class I mannose-6-phosphate isomerase [Chloroflexi bacterium]|nr:class I mannose-6-phosphate isomerase [Chloroflexota bacterium]
MPDNQWRKTPQTLMPSIHPGSIGNAYDIYPTHNIGMGKISIGYDALVESLQANPVIVVDGFPGVLWENFRALFSDALQRAGLRANFVDVGLAMLQPEKINGVIEQFTGGDDPLFGFRFRGELGQFFDPQILQSLKPDPAFSINILYGCGAALAGWQGALVYLDVPKNEIQFRARALSVKNLGAAEALPPGMAYKRSYFVDWVVANKHKAKLLPAMDWMVDEQNPDMPAIVSGADLRRGLAQLAGSCFRVRPWFEPGPWGGQWIKEKIPTLAQDVPNYAWSFELIAPENGLVFESDGHLLEVSFDSLMFQEYRAVLGEAAEKFKYEFPIRYDFLDTVDGGNLSVQVHPRPEYIRKNFGETFTQDECYYILDCVPGAKVNLGFQEGIAVDDFKQVLRDSAEKAIHVEMEKYVQGLPVQKHDLFLIPNGTIHGSGAGTMVLEISATPYIFTFKMYDWLRLGLDSNPRTLNIERAFANLYFDRQGGRIQSEFVSKPATLFEESQNGDYQRVVHLPTHVAHFYDVHRLEFNGSMVVQTENSCHVLSLVEGEAVILETADNQRVEFHYAETFVVPAAAKSYRLVSPTGKDIMVVKTYIKPLEQWIPGVTAEQLVGRQPRNA